MKKKPYRKPAVTTFPVDPPDHPEAWIAGYEWASDNDYSVRDCRLIAMGFERGFDLGRGPVKP